MADECSVILVKIETAIFDFYNSGRLGREKNCIKGVSDGQKEGDHLDLRISTFYASMFNSPY